MYAVPAELYQRLFVTPADLFAFRCTAKIYSAMVDPFEYSIDGQPVNGRPARDLGAAVRAHGYYTTVLHSGAQPRWIFGIGQDFAYIRTANNYRAVGVYEHMFISGTISIIPAVLRSLGRENNIKKCRGIKKYTGPTIVPVRLGDAWNCMEEAQYLGYSVKFGVSGAKVLQDKKTIANFQPHWNGDIILDGVRGELQPKQAAALAKTILAVFTGFEVVAGALFCTKNCIAGNKCYARLRPPAPLSKYTKVHLYTLSDRVYADKILAATGIGGYFDKIVTRDDADHEHKDPSIVTPVTVVMVNDDTPNGEPVLPYNTISRVSAR